MLNFEETTMDNLIIHSIGDQEEECRLSASHPIIEDDSTSELLTRYFLSSFKEDQFYNFHHDVELEMNPVFECVDRIFKNHVELTDQSKIIARHLYNSGKGTQEKGGFFYVALFHDCVVDGEFTDAVGLFKSENQEPFLQINHRENEIAVTSSTGIDIRKLDKGCLVYHTERDIGYKLSVIDKTSKNKEENFWKTIFLNVSARSDNFYYTKHYMNMCHGFVKEVYNAENSVGRADQIDILNKSANFFKTQEVFNARDFEQEVMEEPVIIDQFKEYKKQYLQENELPEKDDFEISENAVKQGSKQMKSILKLDKNFHIYIHGNRQMIEKGYDEQKNMNYYRLFFKDEK